MAGRALILQNHKRWIFLSALFLHLSYDNPMNPIEALECPKGLISSFAVLLRDSMYAIVTDFRYPPGYLPKQSLVGRSQCCAAFLWSRGVWGLCLCGVQPTLSPLKCLYGLEAYSASEDFVLKGPQRLPIGRQRD